MLRISREHVTYILDKKIQPVAHVDIPETIVFETQDCYGGHIACEEDTIKDVDFNCLNPATGPVCLNGVQPGDVLEIFVEDIKINSPGFIMAVPNEGLVGKRVTESVTRFIPFDDEKAYFNERFNVKLNPMIGVIGVAPAGDGVITATPGDHGGNMDTKLIKKGSTLYMPVFVPGGLLALGDLHACMGDGESMYSGLECSGEVTLKVGLCKDFKFSIPFVKSEDTFAAIASEDNLDKALEKAMSAMCDFLMEYGGLSLTDAGFLCSMTGDAQVSQVIDPLKTARMSLPLELIRDMGIKL